MCASQRSPDSCFSLFPPAGGGEPGREAQMLSCTPPALRRGLKVRGLGAPAPTFLHQLPVGVRTAHDQQDCQEHKGQDDAHHGACAQACRIWVLAWGRQRSGGSWLGSGNCPLRGRPLAPPPPTPCSLPRFTSMCQKAVFYWPLHLSLELSATPSSVSYLSSSYHWPLLLSTISLSTLCQLLISDHLAIIR